MADDLKRVGLVFKTDGAIDFKKSIQEVNSSIQENKSAFEKVKSQWDENTKAADKLRDRQKYLAQQTKTYTDKIQLLGILVMVEKLQFGVKLHGVLKIT